MLRTIYLAITIITAAVYAMIIFDANKKLKEKYGERPPENAKSPTWGGIISGIIGIILLCIIPVFHIVIMLAIIFGYEKTVDGIVNNVEERIKTEMEGVDEI